ncbi:hypothetical protein L596_013136 [Steinernema carpocapsae]|uniref:Uncharacterized protein n=1 Tax=Steinernema carpocapsae TaxID=34508 RepID=A0A4U5NZX3_STECR|nr:hypothetical protein L596_013136 [Steinernema carpocapsae]
MLSDKSIIKAREYSPWLQCYLNLMSGSLYRKVLFTLISPSRIIRQFDQIRCQELQHGLHFLLLFLNRL